MKLSYFAFVFAAFMLIQATNVQARAKLDVNADFDGIISSIIDGAGNIGKDIIDTIANIGKDGISFGQGVAHLVDEVAKAITKAAIDSGAAVVDGILKGIQDFSSTIQAFRLILQEAIQNGTNNVIKTALKQIDAQLKAVNASTNALQNQLSTIYKKMDESIDKVDESKWDEKNKWADKKLKQFKKATDGNQNTYKKGEKIVNDFITEQQGNLLDCQDGFRASLEELDDLISEEISEANDTIKSLLQTVEVCLQSSSKVNGRTCKKQVDRKLPKLKSVSKDIDDLLQEAKEIGENNFESYSCVVEANKSYESGKEIVEEKLGNLLNGY